MYDVTGTIAAVRIGITTSMSKVLLSETDLLVFKLRGTLASFSSDSDCVGADSVSSCVATFATG